MYFSWINSVQKSTFEYSVRSIKWSSVSATGFRSRATARRGCSPLPCRPPRLTRYYFTPLPPTGPPLLLDSSEVLGYSRFTLAPA